MADGIAWMHGALHGRGFHLVALKDAEVEDLAVMLGAEPGSVTDPPAFNAVVDGVVDWSYSDGTVHERVRADHPLTVRMTAGIGLGGAEPDPDLPDDPDEWGLHVPDMADVYRLFGEHCGPGLPREVIGEPYRRNTELYGAFTAPRILPGGRPNPEDEAVRLP
ncbi:hypothetical protein [Streptomyces sp. enrichment culture]|uniref:hypothetical protein n=1 Tax=Streptomyces sp. enrichment culture TaxID=1795815 RepID=UPI003F54EDCF